MSWLGEPKHFFLAPEKRVEVCQRLELETNELQDRIVGSPARNVLFRAARRTGKSFTCVKRHFPMSLMPNSMHWIVAPTYDLAEKEFRYWVEFYQRLAVKERVPFRELVTRLRHVPDNGDLMLETAWGAKVIGKSATNQYSLVGEACDSVILAEAAQLSRQVWERYVRPTLSTKKGFASFGSTPDTAGQWLYELELAAALLAPEWAVFTQAAWECAHYPPGEIAQAKKELSDDAFAEQYGGEWRFYTGRVYKVFSADVHLVDPFPIPQSWRIVSGTDWGMRDPTVEEIFALSPTGEAYGIGEYYVAQADLSTEDHAKAMLRTEERLGVAGRARRIADHHGLGGQLIINATRAGFKTVPCRSEDRKARRDAAIAAYTPKPGRHPYHVREAGLPAGEYPNVFLFKDRCPHYVREMQFLRWRESTRREGALNDTEGDDHAVDASEYVIEYFGVGTPGRERRAGNAKRQRVYDATGYYLRASAGVSA